MSEGDHPRENYRFMVGQRVTRREDVFNLDSPLMHGKVIFAYDKTSRSLDPDLGPWYYDELYDVRWESGKINRGYLRYGLSPEKGEE